MPSAIAQASELCDTAADDGPPRPDGARRRLTDIWTVFAIIAAVIVLFVWDRLPVIVVCIGCGLSLWATGVLTLPQSLAGFGDPATVFVASLFVASAALEKTGITAWAGPGAGPRAPATAGGG